MTETRSTVRLAQPSDEAEILELLHMMHAENGLQPLDVDCARETFARAFDRKGGHLAVIGAPGHIRAMLYLMITHFWYTRKDHLEELFCWVHPEHRHSDYSKVLIDYGKKCSDDISAIMGVKVPLFMGVLTNKRMSAKVRLYRRFFGWPAGAIFVHNAGWMKKEDLSEEDIWRMPSLSRVLLKRFERVENKERKRLRA